MKEEGKKQAKQEGASGEQGKQDSVMVPVSQPKAESGEQRDGNALQPAGRKVFLCIWCLIHLDKNRIIVLTQLLCWVCAVLCKKPTNTCFACES